MEVPQSRKGFLKLYEKPVKVTIYTKYKLKKGHKLKYMTAPDIEPDTKSAVEAWMHPLTDAELFNVEAIGVESYRLFAEKGAEPADAGWKSKRTEKCQTLFYSIRTGDKPDTEQAPGSPRLFLTEGEITRVPYEETERLYAFYIDRFIPSGDEIKNCLRERLGLGSGTESSSPNTSVTAG
jgi:hypothetical protein